jgi:hypothetical protein
MHNVLGALALLAPVLAAPTLDTMCAEWQPVVGIDTTAPLSSLSGSCSTGRDILSVGACVFPPYSMGTNSYQYMEPPFEDPLRPGHGEPGLPDAFTGWTGRLLLDGEVVLASRSRWCAHRVEREAEHRGVRVRTSVSLAAAGTNDTGGAGNTRALLFGISLEVLEPRPVAMPMPTSVPASSSSSLSLPSPPSPPSPPTPDEPRAQPSSPLPLRLSVELQGLARRFTNQSAWTFAHPTVLQNETGQFAVAAATRSLLGKRRGVLVTDTRSTAVTALVVSRAADDLVMSPSVAGSPVPLVGGRADYELNLHGSAWPLDRHVKGAGLFELGLAVAVGDDAESAEAEATRLAGSDAAFGSAQAEAGQLWEARWQDAFTAGNARYSGHLPSVEGDPDVARVYYLSALSFLALERRVVDPHVAWKQAYTTGGPRTGVTT